MEYTVVERNDIEKIIEVVNSLIDDGWIPLGGICFHCEPAHDPCCSDYYVYAQAMTRNNTAVKAL